MCSAHYFISFIFSKITCHAKCARNCGEVLICYSKLISIELRIVKYLYFNSKDWWRINFWFVGNGKNVVLTVIEYLAFQE